MEECIMTKCKYFGKKKCICPKCGTDIYDCKKTKEVITEYLDCLMCYHNTAYDPSIDGTPNEYTYKDKKD